jgi:transcriptional regulator with XRE-family HTH domain
MTGNLGDALRDMRRRLSGGPSRSISQQQLSNLLGVSWSTVARWESGGQADPAMLQKLDRLRRVLDALGGMVRPEHRLPFLLKENQLLLTMRPIDLLGTDPGAEAVIRVLEGTKSGAFA